MSITKSNATKEAHLGMSLGKANNILRKSIMFNLLQKLNENICFKCVKIIETVDELSVEHKIPWLYGDINLYWDLNNIVFSHLKCNKSDRKNISLARKDDTIWCYEHKKYLPIEKFHKNNTTSSGYKKVCIDCARIQRGRYRIG